MPAHHLAPAALDHLAAIIELAAVECLHLRSSLHRAFFRMPSDRPCASRRSAFFPAIAGEASPPQGGEEVLPRGGALGSRQLEVDGLLLAVGSDAQDDQGWALSGPACKRAVSIPTLAGGGVKPNLANPAPEPPPPAAASGSRRAAGPGRSRLQRRLERVPGTRGPGRFSGPAAEWVVPGRTGTGDDQGVLPIRPRCDGPASPEAKAWPERRPGFRMRFTPNQRFADESGRTVLRRLDVRRRSRRQRQATGQGDRAPSGRARQGSEALSLACDGRGDSGQDRTGRGRIGAEPSAGA